MKKILIPLLVLALICIGLAAAAEENEAIRLEVNTRKLQVYDRGTAMAAELTGGTAQEEELSVLVIPVKKTCQMQVTVTPKTLKNKKVTLTAGDPEILKISGNQVTGLKPGSTLLTIASAQDPEAKVQYRAVVIQPVKRISVTASRKSVAAGETITLTPEFLPEDATIRRVTWISSNEKAATVDANGTVTGLARGNIRISAIAEDGSNVRANISIQVTQNAEEILLDRTELTVNAGGTANLKATVLPAATNDKSVAWSSSDESIATVNARGRITGIRQGECEITCVSQVNGEIRAKAAVHVQHADGLCERNRQTDLEHRTGGRHQSGPYLPLREREGADCKRGRNGDGHQSRRGNGHRDHHRRFQPAGQGEGAGVPACDRRAYEKEDGLHRSGRDLLHERDPGTVERHKPQYDLGNSGRFRGKGGAPGEAEKPREYYRRQRRGDHGDRDNRRRRIQSLHPCEGRQLGKGAEDH